MGKLFLGVEWQLTNAGRLTEIQNPHLATVTEGAGSGRSCPWMSGTAQVRNELVVSFQRSFHKKIINYKRKHDKFNVDKPDKH